MIIEPVNFANTVVHRWGGFKSSGVAKTANRLFSLRKTEAVYHCRSEQNVTSLHVVTMCTDILHVPNELICNAHSLVALRGFPKFTLTNSFSATILLSDKSISYFKCS